MKLWGLELTKIRKLKAEEALGASLPIMYLVYVLFWGYDSIQQFVGLGLIVLVWEVVLWHRLTKGKKEFAKKLTTILPLLTIFVASVGMGAAYSLAKEKQALDADPTHIASCSINPIVSCAASVTTEQGSALGVSNPSLGIVAYGLLLLLGIGLLIGLKMSKQWWWLVFAGGIFGIGFCVYLFTQSLYVIGTLCLYCSTIWAVTSAFFVYATTHIFLQDYIPSSKKIKSWLEKNHMLPLLIIYVLIILLIYFRWSEYWNSIA
ncbi:hypothetical protein KC992_00585 [Candidatus Saccharibacteria bacterium]|nr:hypothetical protein [Candidatus Saccharibacteria bacterium]MCA9328827.1 hypothetical protein [Candidatus Saccharibacteria bacterium]